VAESFFSNLKSEKIKKWIYQTRAEVKSEIFDYIEGFYNRVRRHKHLNQLSSLAFERKRQTALLNVSRQLGNASLDSGLNWLAMQSMYLLFYCSDNFYRIVIFKNGVKK